jgi:hypothetical protein
VQSVGLSMRWPWAFECDAVECSRMAKSVRDLTARYAMGLAAAVIALAFSACPGPDRLTDPIVSEAGTYFSTVGGSGNSGAANGGSGLITYTLADASAYDARESERERRLQPMSRRHPSHRGALTPHGVTSSQLLGTCSLKSSGAHSASPIARRW